MTPDDRAQLRALLAAATPGEWAPGTPDDDVAETRAEWVRTCLLGPDEPAAGALWSVWVPDDQEVLGSRIVAITGDGAHGRADAELIATAANSLRALLDALDHMEGRALAAELSAGDWACLARWERGRRQVAEAAVRRVRALHFGEYVEGEDEDEGRNRCFECGDDHPCPTRRALDGGQ